MINLKNPKLLNTSWIDTPLGPMIAVGDNQHLYLLEFVDRRGLELEVERLRIKIKAKIIPGTNKSLESIKKELEKYFNGKLINFKTPIFTIGSEFQKKVWQELQKIPPGETVSYAKLAKKIGNPKACRAVANANGANQLSIIIPCHRVINSDGKLGGYGGGLSRKEWLLNHEKKR